MEAPWFSMWILRWVFFRVWPNGFDWVLGAPVLDGGGMRPGRGSGPQQFWLGMVRGLYCSLWPEKKPKGFFLRLGSTGGGGSSVFFGKLTPKSEGGVEKAVVPRLVYCAGRGKWIAGYAMLSL